MDERTKAMTWTKGRVGVGVALSVGGLAIIGGGAAIAGNVHGMHGSLTPTHPEQIPAHAASDAADRPAIGRTEVPLRLVDGRPVVTVATKEGHGIDVLVSTGNGVTVLSETAASHLEGQTLWLGDVEIDTTSPHEIPDEELVYGGVQLHGILGSNTLNRYDVLLDAPGGRLVLQDIGPRVEWSGADLGDPVPLRIYHGIVIGLDVTVDGRAYGAMLDTGASAILLNAGAADASGIEEAGTADVTFGAEAISGTAVRRSDAAIFERWDPDGNGFVIVGASIAEGCAVAISWVHQEMRMCAR